MFVGLFFFPTFFSLVSSDDLPSAVRVDPPRDALREFVYMTFVSWK